MKPPYYNDQSHIAEEFHMVDDHTTQTARLASLKINSYKLSLVNAAFCANKDELEAIIKSSLMNFTDTGSILAGLGFFIAEQDN